MGYEPEEEGAKAARLKKYWAAQDELSGNLVPLDKSLPALRDYILGSDGGSHMNQKTDPMLVAGVDHTYDTGPAKKGGGCVVM